MLLCWGLGALPLAAFGLSTLLWVMVVASLVVGITDAAAMVIWGTLLQRRVTPLPAGTGDRRSARTAALSA